MLIQMRGFSEVYVLMFSCASGLGLESITVFCCIQFDILNGDLFILANPKPKIPFNLRNMYRLFVESNK